MPRRRRSSYSSYSSSYSRENQRRFPSPLPYLVVALLAAAGLAYFHFVVYKSLAGKVTNAYTAAPMPGVTVRVAEAGPVGSTEPVTSSALMTATTGPLGEFRFERVPPSPVLYVDAPGFSPQSLSAEGKGSLQIDLVPDTLTGVVVGPDSKPVAGARVISGQASVLTGPDGRYELKGAAPDRNIVTKAPGYLVSKIQVGKVITQDIALQPFIAKAAYISADSVATPAKLQALMALVDRTELNAVVIDVKADNSGLVLYASNDPLVQELGTSNAIIADLDGLLAELKQRNIYTIARLSVFWDQAVTRSKPEWALKSKKAPGQPWLSGNGTRWANPYNAGVWAYNIGIATEVAKRGFDEVQFDFAYFPSSGELDDIDYGPEQAGRKRTDAVTGFLQSAYAALSPLGTFVAVNVLAFTPFVGDDMGVGQNFEGVATHVDFVCPYLYPSDYPDGFADFAHPAEHPFEVVQGTLQRANARLAGSGAKVRPWLQDFNGKVPYDAPKVRLEIDASEQNGAAGWMLWNFGNTYTEAALKGP